MSVAAARPPAFNAILANAGLANQRINLSITNDDGIPRKVTVVGIPGVSYETMDVITDFSKINQLKDANGNFLRSVTLEASLKNENPMVLRIPVSYGPNSGIIWKSRDHASNKYKGDAWVKKRYWILVEKAGLIFPNVVKDAINQLIRINRSRRKPITLADVKACNNTWIKAGVAHFADAPEDGFFHAGLSKIISRSSVSLYNTSFHLIPIQTTATTVISVLRKSPRYKELTLAILATTPSITEIIDGVYSAILEELDNDIALSAYEFNNNFYKLDSALSSPFSIKDYLEIELSPKNEFVDIGGGKFSYLGKTYLEKDKVTVENSAVALRTSLTNTNPFPIYRTATDKEKIPLRRGVTLPRRLPGNSILAPVQLGDVRYIQNDNKGTKGISFVFTKEQIAMMDTTGAKSPVLLAIIGKAPVVDKVRRVALNTKMWGNAAIKNIMPESRVKFNIAADTDKIIAVMKEWGVNFYILDGYFPVPPATGYRPPKFTPPQYVLPANINGVIEE